MSGELEYAVVAFADLRGFTAWSATATVAPHLKSFMSEFYDIFRKEPSRGNDTFLKPNGDGLLMVYSTGPDHSALDAVLDRFLDRTLPFVEASFVTLVQRYQRIMRCAIRLQLGFGVSAGLVHRLEFQLDSNSRLIDFASGTLNTAARLCDLARPAGVVIAADAFPDWSPPKGHAYQLVEIPVRNVSESFPVWLSRAVAAGGLPREARRNVLEFHVGTVCFDPRSDSVLLGRRRSDRHLYPGLWETGGGQLCSEEGVEEGVARLARIEFGLKVEVAREASIVPYRIETERRAIPGIKLLALVDGKEFTGYRSEYQHDEVRLVPLGELLSETAWPSDSLIPGTKGVVRELITRYLKFHEDVTSVARNEGAAK